jgi:hypothetical protein
MTRRWRRARPVVLLIGSVALGVAAIRGLAILTGLFSDPWSVIPPIGAAVFVVLRLLAHFVDGSVLRFLSRWLGAVAIPILTLLAVDAAWADLIEGRPPPLLGLAMAGVVIGFAVWVYLQTWWTPDRSQRALFWASFFVGLLVIAPPMIAWALSEIKGADLAIRLLFWATVLGVAGVVYWRQARHRDGTRRSKRWRMAWAGGAAAVVAPLFAWTSGELDGRDRLPRQEAVSSLDVVTINGGSGAVERATVSHGWDVAYWNGRLPAAADTVAWEKPGAPPPSGRRRADRVLVLLPDGVPVEGAGEPADLPGRPGEVKRWLAIADREVPREVPTLVLLRTNDAARLGRWRTRLTARDPGNPDGRRHGRVASLLEPDEVGSLAFRFASTSDSAEQDLALAARHRPALFFATGEPYSTPLNADRLLESGVMQICANNQLGLGLCSDVQSSADLENANNHLRFKTHVLKDASRDTTVYVHVHPGHRRELVYLDYWWYLPDNPANAGEGALCGAGFAISGITCHDHQSDWEGVTVVVRPGSTTEPSEPVAVHYSAHDGRTHYEWSTLTEVWKRLRDRHGQPFDPGVDTSLRPLVFVALGTHAAYPEICRRRKCDEHALWRDNRHDGGEPWVGNDEAAPECVSGCLAALPTRDGGTEPARWNAYDGTWGRARCELVFFCNQSDPPKSPGQQGRYKEPWCATRWAEWVRNRVRVHEGRRCYPPPGVG